MIIQDRDRQVYQVPDSVLPRPSDPATGSAGTSDILFNYTEDPFSFSIVRKSNGEALFNTSGSPLIFQSQFLNLRTSLPENPSLYGLGEHTDPFMLNSTDYTRTLWSRDAYGVPNGTNLYGNHPVYYDHRGVNGTHGVFLLNSNGMDIKINTSDGGQYLEYNTLGGVFDFYFLAGPAPKQVASQYAEIVGLPAMQAYWAFGFHQCRYGYHDIYNVAEVVYNYSQAGLSLEVQWTDIDYMDRRKTFTLDEQRFPMDQMRELVTYLHDHQQHYIVMVDPAVSTQNNTAFSNGRDMDIFLKTSDGDIFQGVVWPGPTAFPDWFHPDTQDYWNSQFQSLFGPDDIYLDGLWIDMNEAANFCDDPCGNPEEYAEENDFPPEPPPVRPNPRVLPGFPDDFQPSRRRRHAKVLQYRQDDGNSTMKGLPNRNFLEPPYTIRNEAGSLSNKTINTSIVHANGLAEYDTHNLYGTMMSSASREAMLNIRSNDRPLIITRSTFAGAGTKVGHWLGDNLSTWWHYARTISGMLQFASIYQVPMVGSDVCGFGGNTTETLCARWAMLGAFQPFYRNHNGDTSISQEFYLWPSVTEAAKTAMDIRYRLMDYIYTALYHQTTTGEPLVNPLFYIYPSDTNTFPIDLQWFYGDALLVSPVTEENSTSVDIYLPKDTFYDWYTGRVVEGKGTNITLDNINFTTIPLHIRGGTILPLRNASANTTTMLRQHDFNILIAPSSDGLANGSLYLDEGRLLEQPNTSLINFTYTSGNFSMDGRFDHDAGVNVQNLTILGVQGRPSGVQSGGTPSNNWSYDDDNNVLTIAVNAPLTGPFSLQAKIPHSSSSAASSRPSVPILSTLLRRWRRR